MKFYLTEGGLQELKTRISHLEERRELMLHSGHAEVYFNNTGNLAQLALLNTILENSVVLPEYKSWEAFDEFPPDNESQTEKTLRDKNGVIIS